MKKIRILQLAAVIFFTVSGGPYGLEPLLKFAGDHGAFLLLLITPLLWDVPAILTVLELNSMMPVTGGYYKWVKHALGDRWGFYEGWWTWLYTFFDLAIYPVWFVQYLGFFFPEINDHALLREGVLLTVIWLNAGLNILGIVPVGRTAIILSVVVLSPFLIMFVWFFIHHSGPISLPSPSIKGIGYSSLGMALYTVMWNCLGWDNVTTYAEEVEKPVRSYIRSVTIAFVVTMVIYFFAVLVSQQSGIDHNSFAENGFPALAEMLAGRWLGVVLAIGGMASTMGIYAAVLLSVSRVPKVMSDDKLLPPVLNKLHSRFQTPYISILICSIVVSIMVLFSLEELLIIDVTVYGAGLFLEYLALIKMRRAEPDRHRPFRIPLNISGLILMIILPVTVYSVALSGAFLSKQKGIGAALFAIGALLTAEAAWQISKLVRKRKNEEVLL